MKFTAQLDYISNPNGHATYEHFYFTECSGMCNVTYTIIGDEVEPQYACFRFNSRKQGNAFYLALKRMGAKPATPRCVEATQDSALSLVRTVMRTEGVVTLDTFLCTALISAYVQRVQG